MWKEELSRILAKRFSLVSKRISFSSLLIYVQLCSKTFFSIYRLFDIHLSIYPPSPSLFLSHFCVCVGCVREGEGGREGAGACWPLPNSCWNNVKRGQDTWNKLALVIHVNNSVTCVLCWVGEKPSQRHRLQLNENYVFICIRKVNLMPCFHFIICR